MNWDPRSFRRLCREADARARQARRDHPDSELEFRRDLLARELSLDATYNAIHARWRAKGAAARTIEALTLALRRGVGALKDSSNQRRLSELNDAQLREVATRLQRFEPHIARAWTPAEVETLILLWSELR
jgi:hypothetical protein